MSTPPPPEQQPTRRLEPAAAPLPPAVAYERVAEPGVVPVADPGLLYVRLEDAIASLRSAVVFVGVLAVLAAGLAVYALIKANDDTPVRTRASSASDTRVTGLEDRVDRLSRQVQSARASARPDTGLSQRVDDLAKTVGSLKTQSTSQTAAPDPTQAIKDLGTRLDKVEQQLQTLADQAQTAP